MPSVVSGSYGGGLLLDLRRIQPTAFAAGCMRRPISILIFIHQAGSLVNGWTLCFLSGNYNLWLRLFSNSVIIEENRCSIRCRADCQTIRHKKRKIDD